MKYFTLVDPLIVHRFLQLYKFYNIHHEIVHINDPHFKVYADAITYDFLKLTKTHNNNEDYEFILTEEGEAYITFKLL